MIAFYKYQIQRKEKKYSYIISNSIKAAYNSQEEVRQELIQKLKVPG